MAYTRSVNKISGVLESLYGELNFDVAAQEYQAVKLWHKIVGSYIAKVSEVEKIENGILFVKVKNAAWRNELTFKKSGIIEQLNSALGKTVVKEIIFK